MNFVAIDLETTGTLSYIDHIVECAGVRFSDGAVENQISFLVNPGIAMPEEASKVNGITDEMLKGKPPVQEVLPIFSEFCGTDCLVAHNAIFDFQFLLQAFEKHHCPGPIGPLLDTYTLSKRFFPGLANYKLSTIVEYLKIPVDQFHRAKQDAWACGKIFDKILSKIYKREKTLNINKLIQLSGKKELRFPKLKIKQLSLFE